MGAKLSTAGGRYDLGQNAEINVTPFVDVMLVLLIIFMVAAPLATATLKVDLPTVSKVQTTMPRKPTFIDVGLGGKVFVDGVPSTYGKLIADLTAAINTATPQQERVMIRGDKAIPYGDFVKVMNMLQKAGYVRLGIVGEES